MQPSPVDPDLILTDIDLPPRYQWFGDEEDVADLDYASEHGRTLALATASRQNSTVHSTWSHDGTYIYYHGRSVGDLTEPTPHYGRLYADWWKLSGNANTRTFLWSYPAVQPLRGVLLLMAWFTPDCFAIHLDQRDERGEPLMEPLCRHETAWGEMPGQISHPHPHLSPCGRYLAYNRAHDGGRMSASCDLPD